jgi:Ca2+-binding RTX toxin-like protein
MAVVTGTEFNDLLDGTVAPDQIFGLDGTDFIKGGGGADAIDGGGGTDTVMYGDSGFGVQVNLLLGLGRFGTAQGDSYVSIENVFGSAHADTLIGNGAANELQGGAGDDSLNGGGGDDRLFGDAGADLLNGGLGADRLEGGSGDDVYVVGAGPDVVLELAGGGRDEVRTTVSFTLPVEVEDLVLLEAGGAINGTGNAVDNAITGNGAVNTLVGGLGSDVLRGGAGADTLVGGDDPDRFVYADASDSDPTNGEIDVIQDFDAAERDRIDVSLFDADTLLAGVQDWTFIGANAFTAAGQIGLVILDVDTLLAFNTDDTPEPEMVIQLSGQPVIDVTSFIF